VDVVKVLVTKLNFKPIFCDYSETNLGDIFIISTE